MSIIDSIKKNKTVQRLASIKITVVCLCLLFMLVLGGTIDQVDNGLYHAQEKYFNSLMFLMFGFVPFPGAQLVMWVLFFNLICVTFTRFVYKKSYLGILIIHFGLILYLISGFITLHGVEETNLSLMEGAASNVSSAYHGWELSVWPEEGRQKNVSAFTLSRVKAGDVLDFPEHKIKFKAKQYYRSSDAFTVSDGKYTYVNDSGVKFIKRKPIEKEPEKNIPGGLFEVTGADRKELTLILYGGESHPTKIYADKKAYNVQLRRRRSELPFILQLVDFRMEKHPNTEVARSYESLVEITTNNLTREVLISMNNPLRFKNYTLYQASYAIDQFGREISTLAVVKNTGWLLPYIASFVTFFGLTWHFLGSALSGKLRN